MWGQPQRRSRPTLATTQPRRSRNSTPWEWTRLSRRTVPATAGSCQRRPGAAYQATCRPGTGCAGSCGPNGGRQRYGLRKEPVEPVFGQIKQGRGFRQFLLRGLEKVNREWSLISTGHNLLELFRFGASQRGKATRNGPTGHTKAGHTKAGHTKAGNIKAGHINTGNIKEESWAVGELIIVRLSARLHPSTAGTAAAA